LYREAPDRDEEVSIPLEKARMLAYLYIPSDATVEEARGWLVGQNLRTRLRLSTADLGFICSVHAEDKILLAWRSDGVGQFGVVMTLADMN
jgi:hypothetical protein